MGGACCLHDRGVQKLTLNMLCQFLTSPGEGRPQHNITTEYPQLSKLHIWDDIEIDKRDNWIWKVITRTVEKHDTALVFISSIPDS